MKLLRKWSSCCFLSLVSTDHTFRVSFDSYSLIQSDNYTSLLRILNTPLKTLSFSYLENYSLTHETTGYVVSIKICSCAYSENLFMLSSLNGRYPCCHVDNYIICNLLILIILEKNPLSILSNWWECLSLLWLWEHHFIM